MSPTAHAVDARVWARVLGAERPAVILSCSRLAALVRWRQPGGGTAVDTVTWPGIRPEPRTEPDALLDRP